MSTALQRTLGAKVAALAVGIAMIATSFAYAPLARAQSVDLSAFLSALTPAQLAQLATLLGGVSGGSSSSASVSFTRDLTLGATGADVTALQNWLIGQGYSIPAGATGYFGAQTAAAVKAWQTAKGITPAAGYFGPKSRAIANASAPTTPGTTPVTGNGLKVMLATDSPNNVALVQGQASGLIAKFTFANPTGSEVTVTNLSLKRIGVSNDSTMTNVYLYDGASRLTDSAGISNSAFNFNESAGIFKIPAGGTKTISVRADIAGSTSGQQIGAQLVSVGTAAALDSSVVFPINSYTQTISAADLATVAASTYAGPNGVTVDPANDTEVWESSFVIGTRAVKLESIALHQDGSIDADDIKNLKLYVDGTMIGSAVAMIDGNDMVAFDLTSAPVRLETGTRFLRVMADVVGGSGETFDFEVEEEADVRFVDSELMQPILITGIGNTSGSANTVNAGSVTVTKKSDSPTSNVAVNSTNVKWATFELRATGENVKVESLLVQANTSINNGGLNDGKVFLNGVQVGSTKDLTEATNVEFTFGSSFMLTQGQTAIVDIYADAKTTTAASLTSGETVQVQLSTGSSNGEGMDSGNDVNVPGSNVTGNTITVSSSSITGSKASGYGNQTMIAGTNNAKIGSFTLSAGSTEAVNINTLVIELSANNAASITDLMLKDSSTGAQIGNTKASPSTSNTFSANMTLPASGTKTIDVYANIKSGVNAGSLIATLDTTSGGTGATTGNSATIGADVTGQTITVGSGSLTVAVGAGDPTSNNVIAGASSVKIGEFRFNAVSSGFTLQELMVKVGNDAATSVSGITLKYKNQAGSTVEATQALVVSSSLAEATATFTGLTAWVPKDSNGVVEVFASIPTITNGAKSGAAINVSLDYNNGFKAIDEAGNTTSSVGSADVASAGTFRPRKSIPTIAKQTNSSSVPATGVSIYRFSVTADAANELEWKKLSFTVATSGVTISDFALREVGDSTDVNSAVANANASGVVAIYAGTSVDSSVESIAAGASRTYELRGTVTGWGSGDSVTIQFTEDGSFTANATANSLLSSNIIWSDMSSTGHTTATSDWTNGFLLKDLSTDVQSYSQS